MLVLLLQAGCQDCEVACLDAAEASGLVDTSHASVTACRNDVCATVDLEIGGASSGRAAAHTANAEVELTLTEAGEDGHYLIVYWDLSGHRTDDGDTYAVKVVDIDDSTVLVYFEESVTYDQGCCESGAQMRWDG